MIRFPICLTTLISVAHLIACTSENRFNQDARKCNLRPFSDGYHKIYSDIELSLMSTKIPLHDVDELFDFTAGQVNYLMQNSPGKKGSTSQHMNLSALTQLYQSKELDSRSCSDHCTYVLARLNCNAGSHFDACSPRSRRKSYIKSMVQNKVFPMITRCQPTLIDEAMKLNESVGKHELYKTVTYIAEQVTSFRSEKHWLTFEDVIRRTSRPFHAIRRLINPTNSGFYNNILKVLRRIDELNGGFALAAAIDSYFVLCRCSR